MNDKIMTSDFYCTKCGHKGIPIVRTKHAQREPGHLKKLYCLFCQEEHNHVEIKPIGSKYRYEDFLEEYTLGRFVNGERVALKDLEVCEEKECVYRKQGKCWNANHTHICKKRKGDE